MSTTESWLLDFASDDGMSGFVRLELRPDEKVTWFWSYLVAPDIDGIVVVRDHEVPQPRARLELRADGLWTEFTCETAGEHWTFGLEAFGVRLDQPDDALAGEIGERLPVGFDLEWEVESGVDPGGPDGIVHGEVLVGRNRWVVDTKGRFMHTNGTTDWAALVEHCHGEQVARVLVPLDDRRVLERTLCRDELGIRWSTTAIRG
jgi:hypothetical protein